MMVLSLLPEYDAVTETEHGAVEEVEGRPDAASLVAGTVVEIAASEPAPVADHGPSRGRVLVADDERRIRLAIRVCLEAEGYEVEEAGDGREALAAVCHAAPDLLLLDLAMPNLDGMSTLRLLSTVYQKVMPPVVVLTAHGSILAAEAAYQYGAKAFLEKPVIPETLRAVVDRVLAGREGGRDGSDLEDGNSAPGAGGRLGDYFSRDT